MTDLDDLKAAADAGYSALLDSPEFRAWQAAYHLMQDAEETLHECRARCAAAERALMASPAKSAQMKAAEDYRAAVKQAAR